MVCVTGTMLSLGPNKSTVFGFVATACAVWLAKLVKMIMSFT